MKVQGVLRVFITLSAVRAKEALLASALNCNIRSHQIRGSILKEVSSDIEHGNFHQNPLPIPNINVLYESDHVLAIEKPPHVSHHDDDKEMGILSIVRQQQKEGKISYEGRIYGVHRLDKVTSGILLFAKSSEIAKLLSEAFRDKTVTKYYIALSNKKPKKKKQGWVKGDMVVARRGAWKLVNRTQTLSKNYAMTRFFSAGLGNCNIPQGWGCQEAKEYNWEDNLLPKTMVLFRPYTGRTHQLRVASKSLGLPILGDEMYSGDAVNAKSMERTYLHAVALQVNIRDENITIFNPPSWYDQRDDETGLASVAADLFLKHCEHTDILELF